MVYIISSDEEFTWKSTSEWSIQNGMLKPFNSRIYKSGASKIVLYKIQPKYRNHFLKRNELTSHVSDLSNWLNDSYV